VVGVPLNPNQLKNKMKTNEVSQGVLAGQRLIVGEFRLSKCESINWRDAETNARKTAIVIRHTLEVGDGVVGVSEFPPETLTDPVEYKSPFKKGDRVVCHFTHFQISKGNMEARGKLERVEN